MKIFIKRLSFPKWGGSILLLVSTLVMAVAAAPVLSAETPATPKPEVVMRINGEAVGRDVFQGAYTALLPRMSMHTSISEKTVRRIQIEAAKQVVEETLVYHDAKAAKESKVSAKDIDAAIDRLKKNLQQGQTLDATLKNSGMTMADLKELMRKDITVKRYKAQKHEEFKKRASSAVTGQYMLDYYSANPEKFQEPERLRVKVILVKADPSGGKRVWDQALKRAMEAYGKIKAGEDFVKVSKEYSDHPKAETGGDLGWQHRDSFDEINNAVNALKPGEAGKPAMTIFGYVIPKLEGIKPAAQRKFEELNREKLRMELQEKEYNGMRDAWLKSLWTKAKIEYLSNDMKELSKLIKRP